ncbi:MAG TPA: SDR family oxidoreductase, partial [bacterium]|nr:SDR family oxidoreductase [bacterium]
ALQNLPVRLRCLARKPAYLKSKAGPRVEVVEGDVMDPVSLVQALQGVQTAYYLVHSMGTSQAFEEKDRTAASNFAKAAEEAGISKIIYLGGLGQSGLSAHLSSRQEVGQILRDSGVPTVEFQASIILGSGSLSFELVRALVERLPVMIAPRWVSTRCQPIAIEDVVRYLVEALGKDFPRSEIFQIGGQNPVSYGGLMEEYARLRGLRRLVVPVPVLTPRLSSLWLGLVTPVYARVGRALIEGVRNETIVTSPKAQAVFSVRPLGVREALQRALSNEDAEFAATRWCDSLSSGGRDEPFGGRRVGSRFVDSRVRASSALPEKVFAAIEAIGGERGWYWGDWLWKLRGALDLLAGGVGLRRGRREPRRLLPGDTVDFWRVEALERPGLLRLAAEMKLPGRAWLQFEVEKKSTGSLVRQTALFDAQGLWGRLYWWLLYPIHRLVFNGMLRNLVASAEKKTPN